MARNIYSCASLKGCPQHRRATAPPGAKKTGCEDPVWHLPGTGKPIQSCGHSLVVAQGRCVSTALTAVLPSTSSRSTWRLQHAQTIVCRFPTRASYQCLFDEDRQGCQSQKTGSAAKRESRPMLVANQHVDPAKQCVSLQGTLGGHMYRSCRHIVTMCTL